MLMFSSVRIVLAIQCLKILQIVIFSFISKTIKELKNLVGGVFCLVLFGFFF